MNFRDTYCAGDLHGNFKGLIQALERSPFDPEKDRLITLGDYIDGGVHIEVEPIMKYLLDLPNWVGIIGNHDRWMLDHIEDGWSTVQPMWYEQGGKNTLNSLGIGTSSIKYHRFFNGDCPMICARFLKSLRVFYVDDDNNAYVHAGWNNQQDKIENSDSFQNSHGSSDLYWNRDFWRRAGSKAYPDNPYNKVFIGHTRSNIYPEKENVWNLDSGAGFDGFVTVMNVKTERFWKSDATPDLYENFGFR